MAHGIYTDRDFQVALEVAWHKLTRVAQPRIDHFPEIVPMPCYYNGGKDVIWGDKRFVVPVAQDDMLPVAAPYCEGSYTLFTPREAWEWVEGILSGTGHRVQSIGMLWNRSFWFMSIDLNELRSLSVGDGRDTKFQLNFSGGLDRNVSPQCELSSIVAVCHNTISLSRATGKVLFHEKATKGFNDRRKAAESEIGEAVGMAAVFKAAMDTLATKPCSKAKARTFFAGFLTPEDEEKMGPRIKNQVEDLAVLHRTGKGNRGETEFDLLNAYTQFITHGTPDSKVPIGRRFASSEFGNGADAKADLCRALTTEREARYDKILDRGEELLANA